MPVVALADTPHTPRPGERSPQWILREPVRPAQELLEITDEPVESVARRTGFGTGPICATTSVD